MTLGERDVVEVAEQYGNLYVPDNWKAAAYYEPSLGAPVLASAHKP